MSKHRYQPANLFKRTAVILFTALFLLVNSALLAPRTVRAWKPVAHMNLSETARVDAVADGQVTIYRVDYEAGTVGAELGEYAVDPNILKALRACPSQYRAGVVGADFIPDLAIAQLLVHPDNSDWGNTISNDWLTRIWNLGSQGALPASLHPSSCTDALAAKAFAVGVLVHAAGDLFGHSYMNEFAGGPFDIGNNAGRHILLETYIDRRFADDSQGFYNISIDRIGGLIYEAMLSPGNPAGAANVLGDMRAEDYTFGRLFNGIRAVLVTHINNYYTTVNDYTTQYNRYLSQAAACSWYDTSCSSTWLYAQAAATLAARTAYEASHGPVTAYLEAWRDDIDDGLRAWVDVSFQAHRAFFYDQPQTYYPLPDEILRNWATDHLMGMIGFPDVVGDVVGLDVVRMVLPQRVIDILNAIKAGVFNWILRSALGDQITEWMQYIESPELYFDQVPQLFPVDGACWMPLSEFNASELNLEDTGYDDAGEMVDYRDFRPAWNSETMIKLTLLSREGLTELIQDLGANIDVRWVQMPLVLGYISSMDKSNQGLAPASPLESSFLLARYPAVYRQLFMRQRGVTLSDESDAVACAYRYHEFEQGEDGGEQDDGGGQDEGEDTLGGAGTLDSFYSNGHLIAGWYWLRDAGLTHYAEWTYSAIPQGAGDLTLEMTVLATDRVSGGRGYDALFRLVYGVPGSDALRAMTVRLPNVSTPSESPGYTCRGTVTIPRSALGGGQRLFLRVERINAGDHHVAVNADSMRVLAE